MKPDQQIAETVTHTNLCMIDFHVYELLNVILDVAYEAPEPGTFRAIRAIVFDHLSMLEASAAHPDAIDEAHDLVDEMDGVIRTLERLREAREKAGRSIARLMLHRSAG